MATTTPNNGWAVPTSTDYVKDGATAIETLGDAIDTSAGNTWLPWISFTPTWTNLTVGNGTYAVSNYNLIGKTAFVNIRLVFGSTTAITGDVTLTLPANLTRKTSLSGYQLAHFGDAGTANYFGTCANGTTATNWFVRPLDTAGTYAINSALSATIPFTWTTNDFISLNLVFEVA